MSTNTLTSRERVRLALNHEEPDRVPIDITYTSKPYIDVRRVLGFEPQTVSPDVWDRVKPTQDVVKALGCDLYWVGLKGGSKSMKFSMDLDEYKTEWGVIFRKVLRPDGAYQFEMSEYPITEPTMDALEAFPWPDAMDPARYDGVEGPVKEIYESTDFAICARLGGNIWELGNYLTGQESWMMHVALYPDFCMELMQRVADFQKIMYREGLKKIGKYLSVIRLGGEDFGTQNGLLISPKMFRTMVKPILKDVYMSIKEQLADMGNHDCKLMLHSCGGIEPLIDDFIEIGVDILHPLEPCDGGQNIYEIKKQYGNQITLHGNIDVAGVLLKGTPEEVALDVNEHIAKLAPGGGYILGSSHDLHAAVPLDNFYAMRDAAHAYCLKNE